MTYSTFVALSKWKFILISVEGCIYFKKPSSAL